MASFCVAIFRQPLWPFGAVPAATFLYIWVCSHAGASSECSLRDLFTSRNTGNRGKGQMCGSSVRETAQQSSQLAAKVTNVQVVNY